MRIGILGVGYTGARLAEALLDSGLEIVGTARTGGDLPCDRVPLTADGLAGCTHLVTTIPPSDDDDAALDAVPSGVTWIGYVGSTGVYGDTGGAWVDERAPLKPNNDRRRRRAAHERAWATGAVERGAAFATFRCAGIYGPGRSALDRVRKGGARRIDRPGKVFNHIHVDDIVASLLAAMEREATGVFNLADGHPLPPGATLEKAAALLGVDPPPLVPFDEAELSPMARSFYEGNIRVRATRLAELGVELAHPDALEGLEDIYAAGG